MLKIEKYKEEIKKFNADKDYFECYLVEIATNQEGCNQDQNCSTCLKISLLKLLEEYKEPIKLTRFEYEYLKRIRRLGNNYVARDKDDEIYTFSNKPHQNVSVWESEIGNCCVLHFNELFTFVKWKDKEPWKIEEILSNCEVVEND